ncbi:MAG: hypothetical protein CO129_07560 [Ignavibacteriales bacterium CG_4_9_14_3_um_filter_34_10]|nr:MAG: hypothetical protein CO129_07560 [Ignavibacteriales bacterium CG_4_9_14_3_um_filter_34_10]
MTKILASKYLIIISQLILAIVFIVAGIEKISDQTIFATKISNYKVFPIWSINFIAISLPWIELINGVLLIYGIRKKEIAGIFGFLLFFFIVLIFISILRGLDIDCGCFGTIDSIKVGYAKIYENVFLFILCLHLYFFSDKKANGI